MPRNPPKTGVIRVLVSGAGGDAGQGVIKALRNSRLNVEVFATCIRPESPWLHQIGIRGFIAPPSASDSYMPFVIRLIQRYGVHAFIPTVDGELTKVSRERETIMNQLGAAVLVGTPEQIAVTDDKAQTALFLRQHNFAYPRTVIADDDQGVRSLASTGLPVIVKSRRGRGSRDVHLISDSGALEEWLGDPRYIVQEWLDPREGEYTTGIYVGNDGEVKGSCTFRRELRGGSTYVAERIIDPVLEEPLEGIAVLLGLPYLNIQSMRRGDILVPFEFNGRLSGTTAIVAQVFNAPEMFIRERVLGEDIARVNNSFQFTAMRYYEEVYAGPHQMQSLRARSEEL